MQRFKTPILIIMIAFQAMTTTDAAKHVQARNTGQFVGTMLYLSSA